MPENPNSPGGDFLVARRTRFPGPMSAWNIVSDWPTEQAAYDDAIRRAREATGYEHAVLIVATFVFSDIAVRVVARR